MGWRLPWVSSARTDFNFDLGFSRTEEEAREATAQMRTGAGGRAAAARYLRSSRQNARATGTDPVGYLTESSFRGLPPTNRRVRFSGLEINRMIDGKVAEHWFQLDAVTLFEQLGLRIVPGPRLLPRLLTSPVTTLLRKRSRTVQS
jgi:SnoaL-like polyketide cyclase